MSLVLRQMNPLEATLDLQLLPKNPINLAVDFSRDQGHWLVSISKSSLNAAVSFSRRHRRWFILGSVVAVGYGAYKVLTLPTVAKKTRRISRLLEALFLLASAMATSADSIVLISSDLNHFLLSDSDEVPKSLRQISKISASKEFLTSLSKATEALTKGVIKGVTTTITASTSSAAGVLADPKSKPFVDQLIDKIMTTSGTGFVSVVVGSFARNLVVAYYSVKTGNGIEGWVSAFASEKGKELIAHCIQVFVSSAVKVYLNKSLAMSTCDQIISSITHPKNEAKVKELIVSVCNGAVETLVKTSHNLMISNGSAKKAPEIKPESPVNEERQMTTSNSTDTDTESGSILAIPSNRMLMLDVTGRVTAEMVRSFLDFLLKKLSEGAKKGYGSIRDEVLDKGMEVVKYLSAKSMTIIAVCIALCMQLSIGTRLIAPS
ncbi:hypothetical protein LUZ60_006045 [Juncus effusus]|nr:hypothetical protein LUZ60_006045 [Juncus effusus]